MGEQSQRREKKMHKEKNGDEEKQKRQRVGIRQTIGNKIVEIIIARIVDNLIVPLDVNGNICLTCFERRIVLRPISLSLYLRLFSLTIYVTIQVWMPVDT